MLVPTCNNDDMFSFTKTSLTCKKKEKSKKKKKGAKASNWQLVNHVLVPNYNVITCVGLPGTRLLTDDELQNGLQRGKKSVIN